ncbi:MAG: hypothetical protein JXA66_07405 [Oligoflexia bacterium]|nr:hypothetical protein [Oligoflexia bacterium]
MNEFFAHFESVSDIKKPDDGSRNIIICGLEQLDTAKELLDRVLKGKFLRDHHSVFSFSSKNLSILKAVFREELEKKLSHKANLLSKFVVVSDELLMNAFFNAPFSDGKYLHKDTDRTENIVLDNNTVEIELLQSSDSAVVRCRDYYGSIDDGEILKNVLKTGSLNVNPDSNKDKGAGIGLGLVFYYSDILFFDVSKSRYTEVYSVKYNAKSDIKMLIIKGE